MLNLRCFSHGAYKKTNSKNGDFKHGIQLDSYWIYGPNFETSKWNINETRRRPFNARASVFEADRPTLHRPRYRASVALHGPTELELHFACGLKNIPATAANKVWKYDRYCFFFRLHENCVCVCAFLIFFEGICCFYWHLPSNFCIWVRQYPQKMVVLTCENKRPPEVSWVAQREPGGRRKCGHFFTVTNGDFLKKPLVI